MVQICMVDSNIKIVDLVIGPPIWSQIGSLTNKVDPDQHVWVQTKDIQLSFTLNGDISLWGNQIPTSLWVLASYRFLVSYRDVNHEIITVLTMKPRVTILISRLR